MPVKLILFIILVLVIGTFVGFNAEFTSTIRFWPGEKGTFTDVPILISFFIMYIIGVLSVIPFFVGFRHKSQRTKEKKTDDAAKKTKSEKGKTRVLGIKSGSGESRDKSIDRGEEGEDE